MRLPHHHALRLIGTMIIILILASPPSHAQTQSPTPQQPGGALITAEQAGLAPMALTAGQEVYTAPPTLPENTGEKPDYRAQLATKAEFTVEYVAADKYGAIQNTYPCATFPTDAKNAVTKALDMWKAILNPPFNVPIKVQVCWSYLNDLNTISLVKIPTYSYHIPEIPDDDTLYPISLANSLTGSDLNSTTPEIAILINSRQASNFHYAVDTATPAAKYNFVSVISHNVAHGLGITSSFSVYKSGTSTLGRWGVYIPGEGTLPLSFDKFVTDN